jgi:hypothetical protein
MRARRIILRGYRRTGTRVKDRSLAAERHGSVETQTPPVHVSALLHTVVQLPQWFGSVFVL